MEHSVKQRLMDFARYERISVRELERRCGLSNGYVGGIKHSILPDKMKDISQQFPNLNPIWLLMGAGEMLNSDTDNIIFKDTDEPKTPSNASEKEIEYLREIIEEKNNALLEKQKLIDEKERLIKILLDKS